LDKLWSTIEPARDTLAQVDEEARHSLRIQIKKMRYATEFFDTVFPGHKRKKRFGVAIQELQESLGRLNDLATARLLAPNLSKELSPHSSEELENIAVSEALLGTLCDAGPFWRATKP
jgi:CHAD domain-containing protein